MLLVRVAQAGGEAPALLVAWVAGPGDAAAKLSPGARAAGCDARGARRRPAAVTPRAGGCVLSSVPSDSAFLVPSNSDKRQRNLAWLEVDEQLGGTKQGRGQRALSTHRGLARGPSRQGTASYVPGEAFEPGSGFLSETADRLRASAPPKFSDRGFPSPPPLLVVPENLNGL